MKIEDQVCSLELAKRIKELGVKQESLFWFDINPRPKNERTESELAGKIVYLCGYSTPKINFYSAFTVAELGEMLPQDAISGKTVKVALKDGKWVCSLSVTDNNDEVHYFAGEAKYDQTEANVRAKMLIYLIENKLKEPPNAR